MSFDRNNQLVVRHESFKLYVERLYKRPKGANTLRTITEFKLMRDGEFISPNYEECNDTKYWKGVKIEGCVASLSGESVNHIMAGWWVVTEGDFHYEYMVIDGVECIYQETNEAWRYGKESILWMDTKKKYSYALQCPDPAYANMWGSTVECWVADGVSPAFREVIMRAPYIRPAWWPPGSDFGQLEAHVDKMLASAKRASSSAARPKVKAKEASTGYNTRSRGQNRGENKSIRETAKTTPQGIIGSGDRDDQGGSKGEADGEGETDHEGDPASGLSRLGADGDAAIGVVGIRSEGSGQGGHQGERPPEESMPQGQQVPDMRVGKEKEGEAEGGIARPARVAKAQPMAVISVGTPGDATKRGQSGVGTSTENQDDGNQMELDRESQPGQTSSDASVTRDQADLSQSLALPPNIAPADWGVRRTVAAQTANDRISGQQTSGNQSNKKRPVEDQLSETRPAKNRVALSQNVGDPAVETRPADDPLVDHQQVDITAEQPNVPRSTGADTSAQRTMRTTYRNMVSMRSGRGTLVDEGFDIFNRMTQANLAAPTAPQPTAGPTTTTVFASTTPTPPIATAPPAPLGPPPASRLAAPSEVSAPPAPPTTHTNTGSAMAGSRLTTMEEFQRNIHQTDFEAPRHARPSLGQTRNLNSQR